MSLQFTKEAVHLQPRTHGLLGSTLAAPRVELSAPVAAAFPAQQVADGPKTASRSTDAAESHPLSVRNVVDAILRGARADQALSGLHLTGTASHYALLVAEDDGQVDPDFPEIDASVPITTVGIDKFVLCRADTEVPVLRVVIPSSALALRACEMPAQSGEGGEGALITVTCYPVGAGGTRSFVVSLKG